MSSLPRNKEQAVHLLVKANEKEGMYGSLIILIYSIILNFLKTHTKTNIHIGKTKLKFHTNAIHYHAVCLLNPYKMFTSCSLFVK